MADREIYNPSKLDQQKLEVIHPVSMSEKDFDTSFGFANLISNLVTKSSIETGKPIYLQFSISFDGNPENKIYSTIFKRNICIIPVGYNFQFSIPKNLEAFRLLQKEFADFLRTYPNEQKEAKQELINCYELVQGIYDKLVLNFTGPSQSLTESINSAVLHLLKTFNKYAQDSTGFVRKIVDLTDKLNNKNVQQFIHSGNPKVALAKAQAIPVSALNKMIDEYSDQIVRTLIASLAQEYRNYERKYSNFDNAAIKVLNNLSLVNKQREYKKLYNDFILDPNNIRNAANNDFINICALAGKYYAYDAPHPQRTEGQRGEN